MIKYEELGVAPIHTETKEGTEKIRDIHIEINTILYFYSKKFADKLTTIDIINQLKQLGIKLNELDVNNKKKDEILEQLRTIIKSLKTFRDNFKWTDNTTTIDHINKTISYTLYQFVTDKKNNLTIDIVTKYLKETKRIYNNIIQDYPYNKSNINTNKLIELNQDLFKWLNTYYSIDN